MGETQKTKIGVQGRTDRQTDLNGRTSAYGFFSKLQRLRPALPKAGADVDGMLEQVAVVHEVAQQPA